MLEVAIRKAVPDFDIDINFKLNNGILVLYGPSGSGKTTILQCIAGLEVPNRGKILLKGRTVYSYEDKINVSIRWRNIGFVFQEYALFPHMTVKRNVMFGVKGCKTKAKQYRLSVIDVLEMLNITHLQNRYPLQLSGGERQRVALARALMTEPELLLLDEPLSALDENNRVRLRKELKQLQRQWNIPFVLVTHDRAELKFLADQVFFISRGREMGGHSCGKSNYCGHHSP